jgi:predicted pyridoxine 5'-phosphate oxidase superfamily flavin-nucleotide-binding protein
LRPTSDIAFSPTVKLIQESRGTRASFKTLEERGGWRSAITPEVAAFLSRARSAFISTVNADGQPYVQHRGGPAGFLKVLDDHSLGFADFKGNGQYISIGNLRDNPRVCLIVVDYESRRSLKVWGRATVVEDDADILARVAPEASPAVPEQAILLHVEAWDTHVSTHIPRLVAPDETERTIASLEARIRDLETQLAGARGRR